VFVRKRSKMNKYEERKYSPNRNIEIIDYIYV